MVEMDGIPIDYLRKVGIDSFVDLIQLYPMIVWMYLYWIDRYLQGLRYNYIVLHDHHIRGLD